MLGGKPIIVTHREILGMIFFPVVNETCWVLDEGIAIKASDLDVSSVLGMGFPAYRGGIVFFGEILLVQGIYTLVLRSGLNPMVDFSNHLLIWKNELQETFP